MKSFWILWRRETASFWLSPMAYIILALFLFIEGNSFITHLLHSMQTGTPVVFQQALFDSPFWMIMVLVVTGLTMRLFAEEKRHGTFEILMTAPVTDIEVVLSKYFSACFNFVLIIAPTIGYTWIIDKIQTGIQIPNLGTLASGYLIVLLLGICMISMGLMVSSMTSNQVIAAIITFCMVVASLAVPSYLTQVFLPEGPWRDMGELISPEQQIKWFISGTIDVRTIIYYVSWSFFFIFATVRSIESRKWK
jgi:ABC-2 type transport system permease protein